MLDSSRGAIPLYMQIYQELKQKIKDEVYKYGDNIPTEFELQEIYNVSRITVRQAIQVLEQEGLVVRARGKGTVVSANENIEELLTQIRSFTEEMKDRNMVAGTKFAEISEVSATAELAYIFSCSEGDKLYYLRRVRTANEKPIVLFDTYLMSKKALPLDNNVYYGSIYETLKEYDVKHPVGIEEKFTAIIATKTISDALGVKVGAPIMKRVRKSFNDENDVFEYTVGYYNADIYNYVVYAGKIDKNN